MDNQIFEPKSTPALNATPILSVRDANKMSKITERESLHIAILESMPRDGSGVELGDLRHDVLALTDAVHYYVDSQSNSYPNSAFGAAKQQWSQYTWGWIDRDPVSGLIIYVDDGLDQAMDKFNTPRFKECRDIMVRARDDQGSIVINDQSDVPEPVAAPDVKEPQDVKEPVTAPDVDLLADLIISRTGQSVEDMIRQEIKDKVDQIDRLKQILEIL